MEFSSMLDADWNTRFSIINELVQPPSLVLPYIILFKLNIGISLSHFNSYNLICSKNVHNSHRLILEANVDYVVIVESPEHQGLTQKDNAQWIIRDQPMINLLARINQLHKKRIDSNDFYFLLERKPKYYRRFYCKVPLGPSDGRHPILKPTETKKTDSRLPKD